MTRAEQQKQLRRWQNAAAGQPLPWGFAHDVNELLRTRYEGGDRLTLHDRCLARGHIAREVARGLKPTRTLLSKFQRQALRKRKGGDL